MTLKRLVTALLMLFVMAGAMADELDDAKARGLVGEDASGYIAAVGAADAGIKALIEEVNRKRREEYERIARANDIDVSDVEKLAGKKAIEKTQPGHYIRLPGGGWQRK